VERQSNGDLKCEGFVRVSNRGDLFLLLSGALRTALLDKTQCEKIKSGIMKLKISDIKIGKRHRKNMGDINALKKSIEEVGLLHPIVITKENILVAGERRWTACKDMGWTDIPVTVISIDEIVRGEFAENAIREDFLPTEIDAIRRAMEPIVSTPVGRPSKKVETFHNKEAGKTRDKIGAFAGVSGRTVEKIAKIVEAAEENPEEFGHLAEEIDRTGKVDGAYRKLKQSKDQQEVMDKKPIKGKFKTLVIDPPWDYEWLSLAGRATPGYATMTHEELLALDVAAWADADCHLYLWVTNNFMTRGVDLMMHWGFEHKTVLTWVKPRWGLGSYFRNQTEHVLFGVRGDMMTRADNISTVFQAPLGEHSEKPKAFYDIVKKASYPPYGEAFQRDNNKQEGFKNLFK